MSDYDRNPTVQYGAGVSHAEAAAIDQGLRSYMLSVYNYMTIGLAITGLVALAAFKLAITADPTGATAMIREGMYLTSFGMAIYASPLKWVIMLAPLGMVFLISARVSSMSVGAAQFSFWAFAALMGLSLSSIFIVFTGQSITQVFFLTAVAFGALSLYGYTTKKDLSGWGSFLIMGLVGIIVASLINLFFQNDMTQFIISCLGVLIFAGLTAYDTQRIKEMYFVGDDAGVMGRKAIMGALNLYLDFINMFMFLLQLFGNRE